MVVLCGLVQNTEMEDPPKDSEALGEDTTRRGGSVVNPNARQLDASYRSADQGAWSPQGPSEADRVVSTRMPPFKVAFL